MEFEKLRQLMPRQEWFDFSTLLQLSGEKSALLRTQLHRWCRAGKLVSLRQGLYVFGSDYSRGPINPAVLAGTIYSPSYLSLQWALGFYGMIPERVVTFTSVTTRQTAHFVNALGTFDYRHVQPDLFRAFQPVRMGAGEVWMATPEKALLDYWYLTPDRGRRPECGRCGSRISIRSSRSVCTKRQRGFLQIESTVQSRVAEIGDSEEGREVAL